MRDCIEGHMRDIIQAPEVFNLADYLLDSRVREGNGAKIALRCPDQDWTYAEVEAESNRCASLLLRQQVRVEERVLLAARDGIHFVAALFGILKVGGVVVMLNPDLDADQCSNLINYSRARVAFVEDGPTLNSMLEARMQQDESTLTTLIRFPQAPSHMAVDRHITHSVISDLTLQVIQYIDERESLSTDRYCRMMHRDDPALWLFSGGTTGRPKAIVQPHRSFYFTTECYLSLIHI